MESCIHVTPNPSVGTPNPIQNAPQTYHDSERQYRFLFVNYYHQSLLNPLSLFMILDCPLLIRSMHVSTPMVFVLCHTDGSLFLYAAFSLFHSTAHHASPPAFLFWLLLPL